jgi:hypothetical protein
MRNLHKTLAAVLAGLLALTACTSGQASPADPSSAPTEPAAPGYDRTPEPVQPGDTIAIDLVAHDEGNWTYAEWFAFETPDRAHLDWQDYVFYLSPDATGLSVHLPAGFTAALESDEVSLWLWSLTPPSGGYAPNFSGRVDGSTAVFDFGASLASLGLGSTPVTGDDTVVAFTVSPGTTGQIEGAVSAYFQFDSTAGSEFDASGLPRVDNQTWQNSDGYRAVPGQTVRVTLPEGSVFPPPDNFTAMLSTELDPNVCPPIWLPDTATWSLSDDLQEASFQLPQAAEFCDTHEWWLGLYATANEPAYPNVQVSTVFIIVPEP